MSPFRPKAEMARRPDDGLGVACRVLPPAPSHPVIVAAARRIAGLDVPIPLEKREEAGAAPEIAARKVDGGARPACYKPALRLVAQHRDKFGAIVGLAAQRLVRDDDRGSRRCGRRDPIEHKSANLQSRSGVGDFTTSLGEGKEFECAAAATSRATGKTN